MSTLRAKLPGLLFSMLAVVLSSCWFGQLAFSQIGNYRCVPKAAPDNKCLACDPSTSACDNQVDSQWQIGTCMPGGEICNPGMWNCGFEEDCVSHAIIRPCAFENACY